MNDQKYFNTARLALRAYNLENAELTRLGGADNINFKVELESKSYVLRLRISERHNRATVLSELAWLNSLQKDTSLILPQPVVNVNGGLVTSITLDEREILYTLMTWVEGKIPSTVDAMNDRQLGEVGSLMAQLHAHSRQFKLPEQFQRETFDEAYFNSSLNTLYKALSNSNLNKNELDNFKRQADKIIANFSTFERNRNTFGLIHADFHSGNYLISNNDVRIIDFDRCGFGFYLFDLALALMELGKHQRRVFLQGYEQIQPLPFNYEKQNLVFLCLAYIDNLSFLSTNPDELDFILAELPFVFETLQNAIAV
jgi:Ser/Thr protein kinase RdoA (MazF antagonist)